MADFEGSNDSEQDRALLGMLRASAASPQETEALITRVNAVLDREQANASMSGRQVSRWWTRASVPLILAATALLIVVPSVVSHRGRVSHREYVTVAGQRLHLTLDDGTQLILGPESRLRVLPRYGTQSRNVALEGEAMFTVVHDKQHPFAVRTTHALVQDVGTVFMVRAYDDDSAASVGVKEGAVALSACPLSTSCRSDANAMPMVAGDLATVTDGSVTVQHGTSLAGLSAWLQGDLAFEDTPLSEATREIQRTFGVQVTVVDSALLQRHVTGTFSGQSLTVVLNLITQALGATYEQHARSIVIRRGSSEIQQQDSHRPAPLVTARAATGHE